MYLRLEKGCVSEAPSERALKGMCAVLAALLVAVALALVAAPDQALAKTSSKKACAAYSKMLSGKYIEWAGPDGEQLSTKKLEFACKDINKDGVKDLIVYRTDGCEATGWYQLYTYVKGKVKYVGFYDYVTFYPNKNFFLWSNSGHGFYDMVYYRMTKNGNLKILAGYSAAFGPYVSDDTKKKSVKKRIDGEITYLHDFTVNDKPSSYAKCMKKIKSLEKGAKSNLKFVKNTKANRKKYLK